MKSFSRGVQDFVEFDFFAENILLRCREMRECAGQKFFSFGCFAVTLEWSMKKALLLTNEYPPHIYGGAGIHVKYLSDELAKLLPVEVRCFGEQNLQEDRLTVRGFPAPAAGDYLCPKFLAPVFGAARRSLDFNSAGIDADLVHCHTWYTHLGGIFAKINYGTPLVLTAHSLEPLRPWKHEQLKGGYDFSCWVERTAIEMADAVIAVSQETRDDILRLFQIDSKKVHVIHNGIDLDEYRHTQDASVLPRFGIDADKPYILFLGRITRQKGIMHLMNAIAHLSPDFQIVLCAGAPDTPEIAAEMRNAVEMAQREREGIVWIEQMLDTPTKIVLYSHAELFVCPSIYEPFGIINLEAMACETPVVATATGGIPEVVADGETGRLVPITYEKGTYQPADPEAFSRALAEAVNALMADKPLRRAYAQAGRRRVEKYFSWASIAKQTLSLYETLT